MTYFSGPEDQNYWTKKENLKQEKFFLKESRFCLIQFFLRLRNGSILYIKVEKKI